MNYYCQVISGICTILAKIGKYFACPTPMYDNQNNGSLIRVRLGGSPPPLIFDFWG